MRRLGPTLCLVAYGGALAVAALGRGVPAAERHPEQLFRLWHALERSFPNGFWTADWSPDWWAGFPELQFSPPGLALVAAGLRLLAFWQPSVELSYQAVCALVLLLPAVTTFALLTATLRDGWLALPPAFIALTLSAGLPSGVDGGVRSGLLENRLAAGCLPLLFLALRPWVQRGRPAVWVPPVVAMIILADPALIPAVVGTLAVATSLGLAREPGRRPVVQALALAGLGLALTAFWTLPLLGRRAWAAGVTPQASSLSAILEQASAQPVLVGIALFATLAWGVVFLRRRPFDILLTALPAVMLGLLAADILLSRHGWSGIEPARLEGAVVAAALSAAGLGLGSVIGPATSGRRRRTARPAAALATIALAVLVPAIAPREPGRERDLTLWPETERWPRLGELSNKHGLPELWATLREGSDRVLFLGSAAGPGGNVGSGSGSRLLALTPLFAGREIIRGTSPHPAPLAARLYAGLPARPGPVTIAPRHPEQRHGRRRSWTEVAPQTFPAVARRLRIATVVIPTAEIGPGPILEEAYAATRQAGGFTVFERRDRPWPRLERITHRRYRVFIEPTGGVWIPTGITAYPLWQAKSGHGRLETRTDGWGLLEFRVPIDVFEAELAYAEGWLEWGSLALTLAGAAAWLGWAYRARRRAPSSRGSRTRSAGSARRRRRG